MIRLSTIVLFLLLASCHLKAQSEEKNEKVGQLVDLIYSTQDLNQRVQGIVRNNAEATSLENDQLFLKSLNEEVWVDGMTNYVNTAYSTISELSISEIDSLITVLKSPYGNLLRKAFWLDNALMELHFTHQVNTAIHRAKKVVWRRDSLLYFTELSVDLSRHMNGQFLVLDPNEPISGFERTEDKQIEYLGTDTIVFEVYWIDNSKYALHDSRHEMKYDAGNHFVYNIYEVDGNVFKAITLLPDGTSVKVNMLKDQPIPGHLDAQLFQERLNAQYASPDESPLDESLRQQLAEYGGHQFFPVDAAYRVEADFEIYENPESITIPTSAGTEKIFNIYGKATFELDGKTVSLTIFQNQSLMATEEYANHLFLPFRDATSGKETYGGGKYIDLRIPPAGSDKILIDFNKSYQPSCAYTDGYFCPVPPEENTLDVRIEAGVQHIELGEH